MAAVIPEVLIFGAKVLGFLGGAAGASGLTAFAVTVARIALIAGANSALAKLQAKELQDARDQPRRVNIRSASQPKMFVYGEAVVGSLVAYANSQLVSGSTDNYELHIVDVYAGHQVEDITDLYYNEELVESGVDLDWGNNRVSAGKYGITKSGEYAVKVWKHLGTSSQTVETELSSKYADWTTAHRGRGNAYIVHRFTRFSTSEELWSQGPPSTRRAKVKGKNDIYDPRLDSSPGNDPTNASYQAWTDNPILCAVDWLRWKCDVADSEIDWDSVVAEANYCDELVVIPPAASPENTEKRYTCNGAGSLGASRYTVLESILSSCMGRRVFESGKYKILAGRYRAPDVTLTADVIGKPVIEQPNVSRRDRYNTVRGIYVNKDDQYSEMPFYAVSNATFVTRDNGKTIYRDIELPFTNSEYMAQRIAYKHVLQSDQRLVLSVPVGWEGLQVAPGTSVSLSYGPYSSKTFRCVQWKMGGDSPFSLVLREDASSGWADPAVGEYTVRDAAGIITPGSLGVPAPTTLQTVDTAEGVQLSWTNPENEDSFDLIHLYASVDSDWNNAAQVYEGRADTYLHRVFGKRYYWIRSSFQGVESLREPNSDTSTITGTGLGTPLPNLMPFGYADMESVTVDDFRVDSRRSGFPVTSVYEIDTVKAAMGSKSLKVTMPTPLGGGDWVSVGFGGNSTFTFYASDDIPRFNLRMRPEKTFLIVANLYAHNAEALDIAIRPNLLNYSTFAVPAQYIQIGGRWEQHRWIQTPTNTGFQYGQLVFDLMNDFTGAAAQSTGAIIGFDEIMVRDISNFSDMTGLETDADETIGNLLTNPGAETNAFTPNTTTSNSGTWSVSSSNPRTGTYCFLYDPTGQAGAAYLHANGASGDIATMAEAVEGNAFAFEAWVRVSGGATTQTITAGLRWTGSTGNVISESTSVAVPVVDSYVKVRVTGTAPANTAGVTGRVRLDADGDRDVRIDDMRLVQYQ